MYPKYINVIRGCQEGYDAPKLKAGRKRRVDFTAKQVYNQDKQSVKQMWFVPHLQKNGGDAMKDFKDMLILLFTFGIFLMALLTFIFNFG